jgi:predicted ABC-type ATPase
MHRPELTVVSGPNAAGKSSFIRTRINELDGCELIMTDVYKSRTSSVFRRALENGKDIVLETVFNDAIFKDLADEARNNGYLTSLIVLFLDTIDQSINRVAFRSLEQNGLKISGGNIRINFNENFKNIASYYFYFDHSEFYYTGNADHNELTMQFQKSHLMSYKSSGLLYPQKFADFAAHDGRLNQDAYNIIKANLDFGLIETDTEKKALPRRRLNL